MPEYKIMYEAKAFSATKRKVNMLFSGLDEELRAGKVPEDFKARMDILDQNTISE
jgi:hypothetical protein